MLIISGLVKSMAKSGLNYTMTLIKLFKNLMGIYDMFSFIKRKDPTHGWCILSSGSFMGIF